jgi:drug/metabolite transporter (DMT)-like permease
MILIPEVIDISTAFCYYIALNFVTGSIYQMLRGGTVLTTYFFTLTVLKITPKRQKIVGCLGVLLGMIVVGIVNLLLGEKKNTPEEGLVVVGYGLIILGILGSGLHFIVE